MTPDELETKLTAYALNDPGLTDADRTEIEARLRTDPAARQFLEETRQLGHLLTKSLAAEAQAVEPTLATAVASSLAKPKPSSLKRLAITIASLAAVVMVAAFAGQQYFNRSPKASMYSYVDSSIEASTASAKKDGRPPAAQLEFGRDMASLDLASTVPAPLNEAAATAAPLPSSPSGYIRESNDGLPSKKLAGPGGGGSGFQGGQGFGGGGFQGGGSLPGGAGYIPNNPTAAGRPSASTSALPADRTKQEPAKEQAERFAEGKSEPVDGLFPSDPTTAHGFAGAMSPSGNNYRQLVENPFTRVEGQNALSTFGVDVDTASYSIVRNYLSRNTLPHPDAVRLEEMINYFPYQDAPPDGNDPFTVRVEMATCPWQSSHRLARIALKAKPIDNAKRPPSNLVFLVDVSGSMNEPNKLPLVIASMKLLVQQLGENDRVAIVVYAGASGLVLDSTNASKKETILNSLDSLSAGGSTNGGAGIQLAYDVAVRNYIDKGTNRVILCTDGDWNVGTTGTDDLIKLIEAKKKSGVFLSVFGFGMGNLRDEMMVQLAGKGNGNYGYIDTIAEAKKALVEQISGTLVTVAKDVKIQIEFNPAKISSYRLIGYEKRKLAAKDFADDKKDAGEMGAGHVVTALYELVPVGAAATSEEKKNEGLRYQPNPKAVEKPKADLDGKVSTEAFVVKLRHKQPDGDRSTLREIPVGDVAKSYDKASEDFQFASSVAAFGMLLKQSPFKGQASYALVEELAMSAMTHDPGSYRAEFLQMVKKAKALTGQK